MSDNSKIAPAWSVDQWLNTEGNPGLEQFRGKVVMLHAFQMLCPGCVSHALPQAQRAWETFSHDDLMVVGLHTVFEHHDAMTPVALKAFVHEYRLTFPIAVDSPGDTGPEPKTMRDYGMRGTPTLVLIDRSGVIRRHSFGRIDDLVLGAELATLNSDARCCDSCSSHQHCIRVYRRAVCPAVEPEGTAVGCYPITSGYTSWLSG